MVENNCGLASTLMPLDQVFEVGWPVCVWLWPRVPGTIAAPTAIKMAQQASAGCN
jgi:hypothetical protein